MKAFTLIAAGLLMVSPAFAQDGTNKEIRQDKKVIRQERHERNEDLENGRPKAAVKEQREINHEQKGLRHDREVRHDRKEIIEDKRERNEDLREGRNHEAVKEQRKVNHDRKELKEDLNKGK
jgi:hypothetical protein